jgi:DNA (cytosine-5)-methyltransferase 1|nr:MAG TPA: Cytosine specific methyltransferase [Bacteriophage sp.]
MEKLTDAIGIVLFESEKFGGEKVLRGGICPTLRANKTSSGVIEVMADVNVIGSLESKFESTNRIYDVGGCSPTLSTMQGGGQEPKILESQIVAMRGRNPDNPSDRSAGSPTEQRLEVNTQGTSNCLTSVQKDNLVMENVIAIDEQNMSAKSDVFGTLTTDGSSPKHNNRVAIKQNTTGKYIYPKYRIRKLTPRECGRLMGVSDEDIDKMTAVNSDSQLYKQFGNSIVVDIMCAMFKNLNIKQGE